MGQIEIEMVVDSCHGVSVFFNLLALKFAYLEGGNINDISSMASFRDDAETIDCCLKNGR